MTKVYVLVEAQDHSYRGVFGNVDLAMAVVDDERQRDPDGWRYKLQDYFDRHFLLIHAEVQGE